jgi:hypothetical protein
VPSVVAAEISAQDRERAERMQWLREETERMQREEEEETRMQAAAVSTEHAQVHSISTTSGSLSASASTALDPASSLGRLAAKVRTQQSVSVYLATGPTAEYDRSVFVSKYIPLLRTLCSSSGVNINIVQHGGSSEALATVMGGAALDHTLHMVAESDIFVGIFGAECGPAAAQEQLDMVCPQLMMQTVCDRHR